MTKEKILNKLILASDWDRSISYLVEFRDELYEVLPDKPADLREAPVIDFGKEPTSEELRKAVEDGNKWRAEKETYDRDMESYEKKLSEVEHHNELIDDVFREFMLDLVFTNIKVKAQREEIWEFVCNEVGGRSDDATRYRYCKQLDAIFSLTD